jgi:hypothetical protein
MAFAFTGAAVSLLYLARRAPRGTRHAARDELGAEVGAVPVHSEAG